MTQVGTGKYTYEIKHDFPKLPAGEEFGVISRVATDSQDRFYVFQRKDPPMLVFDREGKPWMIIECKAPALKISTRTVHQASIYNFTLKAKYLVVTNGLKHFCYQTDWINTTTTPHDSIPEYS